jgi:hypothetical protein
LQQRLDALAGNTQMRTLHIEDNGQGGFNPMQLAMMQMMAKKDKQQAPEEVKPEPVCECVSVYVFACT